MRITRQNLAADDDGLVEMAGVTGNVASARPAGTQNKGGYPLLLVPDDNKANAQILYGPGEVAFAEPFSKLSFDVVTLGGGEPGDTWDITVGTTLADEGRGALGFALDRHGCLSTANAARTLLELDQDDIAKAWQGRSGTDEMCIGPGGEFLDAGEVRAQSAFDCSAGRVLVTYFQEDAPIDLVEWGFTVRAGDRPETTSSITLDAIDGETSWPMGAVNNFTNAGMMRGVVELGARRGFVTDYARKDEQGWPFPQLRARKAGGDAAPTWGLAVKVHLGVYLLPP